MRSLAWEEGASSSLSEDRSMAGGEKFCQKKIDRVGNFQKTKRKVRKQPSVLEQFVEFLNNMNYYILWTSVCKFFRCFLLLALAALIFHKMLKVGMERLPATL